MPSPPAKLIVRFLKSSTLVDSCPPPAFPEYAFIGRSNVGKSSLINMLTGVKHLARVSSTPGKTQLINHFLVTPPAGVSWYLVDLPGYGFAKTTKYQKAKWETMMKQYLVKRATLMYVILLIDIRLSLQSVDSEFMQWLGTHNIPFVIAFTKSDKLNRQTLNAHISQYKSMLMETWEELPPLFITSSKTAAGRGELLQLIHETNASLFKQMNTDTDKIS